MLTTGPGMDSPVTGPAGREAGNQLSGDPADAGARMGGKLNVTAALVVCTGG
jgi:hypothetical protein